MTTPSGPNDWRAIIEDRADAAKVGGPFEGARMILVHSIGARTGAERVNPLVWFPDGERMLIVASKAGADTHPDWYHNLRAHPRVEVEVGAETFEVEARELTDDERAQAWPRIVEAMAGSADYQRGTTRTIPVLALTRAG